MPRPLRTIAVFTDQYADYQKLIVDSLAARLACSGYACICITGGELHDANSSQLLTKAENEIYSRINSREISGAIILTGTLSYNVDPLSLQDFLKNFDIPVLSFGLELPGIPSVAVDDAQGMQALMNELLQQADNHRFAFIRGYKNDPYSTLREHVFRDTLETVADQLPAAMYVEGNYDDVQTFNGVRSLLETHSDVGTIVAANDDMAASAVRAVSSLGLRIPDDIAVTGFDDTFEALQCQPALTTVRQPLMAMTTKAADLMLLILNNKRVALCHTFESQLVIRDSSRKNKQEAYPLGSVEEIAGLLSAKLSGLHPPASDTLNTVADSLVQTLEQSDRSWQNYCQSQIIHIDSRQQLHWWMSLCFDVKSSVLPRLPVEQFQGNRLELLQEVITVSEALWGRQRIFDGQLARARSFQTEFQNRAANCSSLAEVLDSITYWIESIQSPQCYLKKFPEKSTDEKTLPDFLLTLKNNNLAVSHGVSGDDKISRFLPTIDQAETEDGYLVLAPITDNDSLQGYLAVNSFNTEITNLTEIARCLGRTWQNIALLAQLESKTQALKSLNSDLSHMANYDPLTGLPNRRSFMEDLSVAMQDEKRQQTTCALMFLDLDGFKSVNDLLGHSEGDRLLKETANRLLKACEKAAALSPCTYRLAGDEFTLIVAEVVDSIQLEKFATDILTALENPPLSQHELIDVTASIGICLQTSANQTVDQIISDADTAMYTAKNRGKNQICFYDSINKQDTRKTA